MKGKGITLIEVVTAMGIAIVVGSLLMVIIINSAGLFYKESSKVSEGLSINDALSKVSGSIKQSSSIANSYTVGSSTYTSGATQLVLKIPSQDSSGNIIPNTFDFYVFFQDQAFFHFKTFPNAGSARKTQDQILSNLTDSLIFKYFDSANPPHEVMPALAAKVQISLTLKQKSGAVYETNSQTSEANLRND